MPSFELEEAEIIMLRLEAGDITVESLDLEQIDTLIGHYGESWVDLVEASRK